MPKSYTVVDDYHDSRLDRWFKQNVINLPHSLIEKIIRQNKIKVNKKKIKSSYRIQSGDLIEVYDISKFKPIDKEKKTKYTPKKKELGTYDNFVIEDNENFIVLNKPSGIPVQAGTKSYKNLIDIIKNTKYFKNSKPYIVHRIDKETSGILIIAKNRKFAQLFTSLFRIRKIHKTYLALVYGKVNNSIKSMRDELFYYEGNKKISQKEMISELNKNPENFSPNVLMRPLYQEVILPNLCYIGGPSEMSYWLQLKSFFDYHSVVFPIINPRASVLLLTPKMRRKINKYFIVKKFLLEN